MNDAYGSNSKITAKYLRSRDSVHLAAFFEYVASNAFECDERFPILKERRRRVRTFVRSIIDEHNALKDIFVERHLHAPRLTPGFLSIVLPAKPRSWEWRVLPIRYDVPYGHVACTLLQRP